MNVKLLCTQNRQVVYQIHQQINSHKHRLVVLTHALGFCKEVFNEVVENFVQHNSLNDVTLVSVDLGGHGGSKNNNFKPPIPFNQENFGKDILDVIQESTNHYTSEVYGFGHSVGGTALLYAELERPKTFASVALIEPVILPTNQRWEANPLRKLTLKRKNAWPSRQACYDGFHNKGIFASWTPQALFNYVQYGTHYDNNGGVYKLNCDPAFEAECYAASNCLIDHLSEFDMPVQFYYCKTSKHLDSLGGCKVAYHKFARNFKNASVSEIEHGSHFVVMEYPQQIASLLADFITPKVDKIVNNQKKTYSKL